MDIKTLKWSPKLCNFFDINQSFLPTIKSSAEVYGHIAYDGCPLPSSIPIAGCLGDQQAALVGQKCFNAGMAKNTYGTGCFMLYNVGPKVVYSNHGLLSTVAYQLGKDEPPTYALE
jgi:glycerol kinase